MGRPKRPIESLMVDMPLKVLPETAQEIESLALKLERSKSFINRKLVLRGLAAYLRDGQLDEPIKRIAQPAPATNEIPKKPFVHFSSSGTAMASKKEKGGRK